MRAAHCGDDRFANGPASTPAHSKRQQTSPLACLVCIERYSCAINLARLAVRPQLFGDCRCSGRFGDSARVDPSGRARNFAGTSRCSTLGAVTGYPLCRPPPRLSSSFRAAGAAPAICSMAGTRAGYRAHSLHVNARMTMRRDIRLGRMDSTASGG